MNKNGFQSVVRGKTMALLEENKFDVVEDVLNRPFSGRSIEEKMQLVKMDTPRPKMANMITTCVRKGKTAQENSIRICMKRNGYADPKI